MAEAAVVRDAIDVGQCTAVQFPVGQSLGDPWLEGLKAIVVAVEGVSQVVGKAASVARFGDQPQNGGFLLGLQKERKTRSLIITVTWKSRRYAN